ncbi:hypothetical protein ACTWP4_01970 [Gracilibacillus sp. D59]|uniref:hypothetical protein n=1 Tax=Gracilibacillus sp. D59 TaxID=3457434 RepID=UPI003FCE8B9D
MSIPEGLKALDSDSTIVTVKINKCCDWLGYTFTDKGWHYLSALLKEYIKDPTISYKDSILNKYYQSFQPKTIQDCLFVRNDQPFPPITNHKLQLPWGVAFKLDRTDDHHYGPKTDIFIKNEFIRTIRIYKKLALEGYQPEQYADGYIKGHFLKNKNNYRFLISGGQHRIAALGVLGYDKIQVKVYHKWKRVIDIENIQSWPHVLDGMFDKDSAMAIFHSYFSNTGKEKAKKLHLLN